MVAWFFFLFVALPIVEIYVGAEVAGAIGADSALLLLIVLSAAGAWIVKREGLATARRVREGVATGRMPTSDVIDGLVVLGAGLLLLVPGFLTAAVGLFLLIPPARALVKARVAAGISRRVARRAAAMGFDLGGVAGAAGAPGAAGAGPAGAAPGGARGPSGAAAGSWRPGWGPGGARPGPGRSERRWRAYRRPEEPDPAAERVWGARVRDPATPDVDVIDIDGEEIVFPDSGPELGPSR